MHNHESLLPPAQPVNLNDNVIVGNRISGNGADTPDPRYVSRPEDDEKGHQGDDRGNNAER